jgi:murein DD-endopeptidase MepM/ murein hydrolase activator NlpD
MDYKNKKDWGQAMKQFDLPTAGINAPADINHTDSTHKSFNRTAFWFPRLALLAGCATVMGNIPLQSRLNSSVALSQSELTANVYAESDFDSDELDASITEEPDLSIASADESDNDVSQNSSPQPEIDPESSTADDKANTSVASADTTKADNTTTRTKKSPEDTSMTSQAAASENIPVILTKGFTIPDKAVETLSVDKENTDKLSGGNWKTHLVSKKDDLKRIARKLGFKSELETLQANSKINKELAKVSGGYILRAKKVNGKLAELITYKPGAKKSFVITPNKDSYSAQFRNRIIETRQARKTLYINYSWRFDANKAKLPQKLIKQFVKVFDRDVNLTRDLRKGDRVTLIFEEVFHNGEKIATHDILAAEMIHDDRSHRAIRYTDRSGHTEYFTPNGRDLNKAFVRYALSNYKRVSSQFSLRRFHPIKKRYRPHTGTDFAARRGTPIHATGNGVIKFASRKGGYGNTIIIQHNKTYTTLYGHMSKFAKGIKLGKKVYLGDVIGYVGSSGWSTGPHLHYEFRINNTPVDPMKVELPHGLSLDRTDLTKFKSKSHNLVLQLDVLNRFAKARVDITSAFGG